MRIRTPELGRLGLTLQDYATIGMLTTNTWLRLEAATKMLVLLVITQRKLLKALSYFRDDETGVWHSSNRGFTKSLGLLARIRPTFWQGPEGMLLLV